MLNSPKVLSLKIPEKVSQEFSDFCDSQEIKTLVDFNNSDLQSKLAHKLVKLAPQILAIKGLIEESQEKIMAVISGLPANEVLAEKIIMAISYILNQKIRVRSDEAAPFNTPFHRVKPKKGLEESQAVNYGAGFFPLHQDRVENREINFLALYGIQTEENQRVETVFVDVRELVKKIPKNLLPELFKENFKTKFGKKIALLHGDINNLDSVTSSLDLAEDWIKSLSEEGEKALEWLRSFCKDFDILGKKISVYSTEISPGTLVIVNQPVTLHGRKEFHTDQDTNKRRLLVRSHLEGL